MNIYQIIFLGAVLIMNAVGFIIMGVDKKRAIKKRYRVSEATLFAVATAFGGVGSTCGMFYFRHKTKHWYFRLGFPVLAALTIVASIYIFTIL